jgi:hypothetical protein
MTSAQASRAMMSSPTLKVIQLPSPTTGNVSPVDGIGLVMIARPWESAGLGRNTAVPAAAKAPRRLRRLRCSRFRIEMLFSEAAALEAARDHRIIYEANRPKRRRFLHGGRQRTEHGRGQADASAEASEGLARAT